MNKEIYSILETMKIYTPKNPIATSDRHTDLSIKSAILSVLLAEEAEKSAKKITNLTWALFALTAVLLVVAIIQVIIFK